LNDFPEEYQLQQAIAASSISPVLNSKIGLIKSTEYLSGRNADLQRKSDQEPHYQLIERESLENDFEQLNMQSEAETPVELSTSSSKFMSCWTPSLARPAVDTATTAECDHRYLNKWGSSYHCINPACNSCEITDLDRLATEENLERNTPADTIPSGSSSGKLSQERGITIGFLLDFTNHYDCWEWTSGDVIRRIVKPATEVQRSRFVELPEMQRIVGPAHTFVSYAQAGKWGNLVAAILDGGADRNRRIWLDIFAVRQWPCSSPDLDFETTIEHCKSFLIVCQPVEDIQYLSHRDLGSRKPDLLSNSAKKKIAFYRVWCLLEVCKAISMREMPIIIKCGELGFDKSDIIFKMNNDDETLVSLSYLIDIRHAEATVMSDKSSIMERIGKSYGIDGLNKMIRGALYSAYEVEQFKIDHMKTVQCAACGDHEAFVKILEDQKSVLAVAAGGYIQLFEKMRASGYVVDVNVRGGENNGTALMFAATGGHVEMVLSLIDLGSNVNTRDDRGDTPLERAAKIGHADLCVILLSKGADVHSRDNSGRNGILFRAAFRGDAKCAEVLLKANISVHDKYALLKAAEHGHLSFLKTLITHGSNVNVQDPGGRTPLMLAAQHGSYDCSKLLLESGADINTFDGLGETALVKAANEIDLLRETALVKASNERQNEIVSLLLDSGAETVNSTYMVDRFNKFYMSFLVCKLGEEIRAARAATGRHVNLDRSGIFFLRMIFLTHRGHFQYPGLNKMFLSREKHIHWSLEAAYEIFPLLKPLDKANVPRDSNLIQLETLHFEAYCHVCAVMWRVIFMELRGLTSSKGLELNPLALNTVYEHLYDVGALLRTEAALSIFEPGFRPWPHIYQGEGKSKKFYTALERGLESDMANLRAFRGRSDETKYVGMLRTVLDLFGHGIIASLEHTMKKKVVFPSDAHIHFRLVLLV
jgi:hypothetical protein